MATRKRKVKNEKPESESHADKKYKVERQIEKLGDKIKKCVSDTLDPELFLKQSDEDKAREGIAQLFRSIAEGVERDRKSEPKYNVYVQVHDDGEEVNAHHFLCQNERATRIYNIIKANPSKFDCYNPNGPPTDRDFKNASIDETTVSEIKKLLNSDEFGAALGIVKYYQGTDDFYYDADSDLPDPDKFERYVKGFNGDDDTIDLKWFKSDFFAKKWQGRK